MLVNPLLSPGYGGIRYPNPLLVPHTLGDFKKSGGHPQFPRQRVIPLDFPLPINECLTEQEDTPKTPVLPRKDTSCRELKVKTTFNSANRGAPLFRC